MEVKYTYLLTYLLSHPNTQFHNNYVGPPAQQSASFHTSNSGTSAQHFMPHPQVSNIDLLGSFDPTDQAQQDIDVDESSE